MIEMRIQIAQSESSHRAFSLRAGGFTIVEVLVVIGIVGLLFSLSLSAIQKARDSASRAACANNLHQVGIALQSFHAEYGHFPPGRKNPILRDDTYTHQKTSWQVYCLPHIGRAEVWQLMIAAYTANADSLTEPHRAPRTATIRTYQCSADPRLDYLLSQQTPYAASLTSYVAVTGSGVPSAMDGMFGRRPGIAASEVLDGLSNTIMVGERPPPNSASAGWWYTTHKFPPAWYEYELSAITGSDPWHPECGSSIGFAPGRINDECDYRHFWSLHVGGGNFLMADGAVRFLPYSAPALLPALATRAGGEVIELPN